MKNMPKASVKMVDESIKVQPIMGLQFSCPDHCCVWINTTTGTPAPRLKTLKFLLERF